MCVCVCVCVAVKPWKYLTEILQEKNGSDTELLIFTMTLINKVTLTTVSWVALMLKWHTLKDIVCVCISLSAYVHLCLVVCL